MTENSQNHHVSLRLGISSCLLGQEVRFDSGHKRDAYVTDVLSQYFEWVPVCPEVESGMPTPRPALRLIDDAGQTKMIEIKSGKDHTQSMLKFSDSRVRALRALELGGYVLKKNSPSCGMTRVKVWSAAAMPQKNGRGIFASALMDAYPSLPVEEEGRLHDPSLRENFIERVFAYARLRELFRARWTPAQVMRFHTAHKLQLMSHSPLLYRQLGRLVAAVKATPRQTFRSEYEAGFMQALTKLATPGRNANVLQHAAGYVKKEIDSASRVELAESIHDYRKGLVPLIVPISLLRHYVRIFDIEYLRGQVYLDPHPKELMLRNHV